MTLTLTVNIRFLIYRNVLIAFFFYHLKHILLYRDPLCHEFYNMSHVGQYVRDSLCICMLVPVKARGV